MKLNLSKRISAIVGIIVLLVTLSIGIISELYSSKMLLQNQEENMTYAATEGAKRVQASLQLRLDVLTEIASNLDMGSMDWNLQKPILEHSVDRLGYLDMAVVTPDGMAQYIKSGETADLSDRGYIQKALAGEANVSDVIISKVTNSPVIMYAAPISLNNQVVGALIARNDGTALNTITDEFRIGKRGYAYILGADSVIYSHPNRDLVINQTNVLAQLEEKGPLTDFATELKKLGTGKSGIITYKFEKDTLMAALTPIDGTTWTLGIANYEKDVLAPLNNLRMIILGSAIVIALIGLLIGFRTGAMIAKPIKRLLEAIDRMANYDLQLDENEHIHKIRKRSDEIGVIANASLTMAENLRALIMKVAQNSEQVAAASQQLTSTTTQSAQAANEVARTIEEISRGATDQATETESGASNIQTLSTLIAKVQDYVSALDTSIDEVDQLKENGLDAMKELNEKNQASMDASLNIRQVIVETNESAGKIESASNMIKSIASQTNLLALNAAIEAARAGEAGKGFAVVADEIRVLAEQSNHFTHEIDTIIQELAQKTESSVRAIEDVGTIMNSQSTSVQNTSEKFNGISDALEHIKALITKLNNASNIMTTKKEEIVSTMENLSAISEENAASTEEASASMEEQTATMDEITSASDSLSKLAEELQNEISRFKY